MLSDIVPIMENTCPKCKYQATKPHDTLILKGECPRCGLILSKFQQQDSTAEAPAPREQQDIPVAPNQSPPEMRPRSGSSPKSIIIFALLALIIGAVFFKQYAATSDSDDPNTLLIAESAAAINAYAVKVREARGTEGYCFPEGTAADQFEYYRKVYIDTGEPLGPDINSILAKYLPLYLSRNISVRCDETLELLLFNGMCFRQQLLSANMIQNNTWKKLRNAATAWGEFKEGLGEGEPAFKRLIRGFDAQCPFCDPEEVFSPVPSEAANTISD